MKNKAVSSGIWFTISNFLIRAIGFITTPIFTRLLTKAEFGDYNNFVTWTGLLLIVTSLNLEASLIRARFDFENDIRRYVKSMMLLSTFSTCVWFFIFMIFRDLASGFLSMDVKYIYAMFVYLLFYPIINIFQTLERFYYRYKVNVAISIFIAIVTAFLSVLLVMLLPSGLDGRVIGYIVPVALVGIVIIVYLFKDGFSVNLDYWKYALPFALPFIPHLLSMNLLSGMDRIMIKQICSSEDLALYSLAYTCGSIITIIVNSINSAFSPWLGEKLSKNEYQKVKKVSFPYVAAFCYLAAAIVLVTPEILLILGGEAYIDAKYVMPPVAASCIMQYIYCMYVNVEQFEKKTKLMAVASAVSAFVNYILNSIFIPIFGYVAAAYTTYAGYFVLMALHMLIVKHINMSHVYDTKKILILAITVSALMFGATVLLNNIVLRYVIFAIYAFFGVFIIIKHKEQILKIIGGFKK